MAMPMVFWHDFGDAVDALIGLLRTAPVPGLPDGLHYPSQLRAIAEASGLAVEPEFDLEDYMAQVRRRLGWDPETEGVGGCDGVQGDKKEGRPPCPAPTLDDVPLSARLRDRLAAALNAEDDATCAVALTGISADHGLFVGLDAHCRPRMMARKAEFLPQLAAPLTTAALGLAASGLRLRLGHCADPQCALPFFDRSHDGRGRYCSATCSSRAKARRRRDRDQLFG